MRWNAIAVFVEGIDPASLLDMLPLRLEPTDEPAELDPDTFGEPGSDGVAAELPGWSALWLSEDALGSIEKYLESTDLGRRVLIVEMYYGDSVGGFQYYYGDRTRKLLIANGRIQAQQGTPLPEELGMERPGRIDPDRVSATLFPFVERLVGVAPLAPGIPWRRVRRAPHPDRYAAAHMPELAYGPMLLLDRFVPGGWASISVFVEGIVPRDLAVFLPDMYKVTARELTIQQAAAPSLAPAIAVAAFDRWDAAWMPGVDLVRLDARLAALSTRRRVFLALCEREVRCGFIWYEGGSARRALMVDEGEYIVDHGDPLPEEEGSAHDEGWDHERLFELAGRLTGVGLAELESATYRHAQLLLYPGDPVHVREEPVVVPEKRRGFWPYFLGLWLILAFGRAVYNGCSHRYSDGKVADREAMLDALAGPTEAELALVRDIGFDERVLDVARTEGDSIRRFHAIGAGDSLLPRHGLEFSVTGGAAGARLASAQPDLNRLGYQAFISSREPGAEHDAIAIIRGTDQFEILRMAASGQGPTGPGIARVIETLADWEDRFGLRIEGAGRDWVDLVLLRRPESSRALAQDIFVLAPDSVGKPAKAAIESSVFRLLHGREICLRWPVPRPTPDTAGRSRAAVEPGAATHPIRTGSGTRSGTRSGTGSRSSHNR